METTKRILIYGLVILLGLGGYSCNKSESNENAESAETASQGESGEKSTSKEGSKPTEGGTSSAGSSASSEPSEKGGGSDGSETQKVNNPETKDKTDKTDEKKPELTGEMTTASFEKTFHDFGKVKETELYKHKYIFTNTGTKPLKILSKPKGSCGCTTALDWSKDPVPPGQQGYVLLQFDPKGKKGLTKGKYLSFTMNTPEKTHKVSYNAEVITD